MLFYLNFRGVILYRKFFYIWVLQNTHLQFYYVSGDFPGGSVVDNLPANAGDLGSVPGSGRSTGEGNGNLLQPSCLGNLMDRRAWRATIHGVARVRHNTAERLNPHPHHHYISSLYVRTNVKNFHSQTQTLVI